MRQRIYTHNPFSRSARALSEYLDIPRIKHENSRYFTRNSDVWINWGASEIPIHQPDSVINKPSKIVAASNKLLFFAKASDTELFRVPEYTTDPEVAKEWPTCVSRTLLRASEGRGIVITQEGEEPPEAPLYVRYVKKQREYRIHVMDNEVIDIQRKIRDPDREPDNWQIRNHSNGFIFVRNTQQPMDESKKAAVDVINYFELEFGAVDLIETESGKTFVLEVNTAPGLEGTTLTKYGDAFRQLLA